MEVIWKDIPGYEGLYQVSNTGLVKSLPKIWVNGIGKLQSHNGIILKQYINADGYCGVALSKNKTSKSFKAHRLVISAFCENVNNLPFVDHIDADKQNNNITNLRWCTGRQNAIWKNEKNTKKSCKSVGVDIHKASKMYRARIIIDRNQKCLGYYKTEEEAKFAYDNAVNECMKKLDKT
jgi:hypothetical protein